MTDTIKRRLESPVNTPDDKMELKRSKIPLALKSPVPIRREIKESGSKSRTPSVERVKKNQMTDSTASVKSTDSKEKSSVPLTPATPERDSSTFNLLKDSELFTQLAQNNPKPEPRKVIVKSEAMDIVKSDVDADVQFIPQKTEVVEISSDSESESTPNVNLGSSPKTFVVEVKKLDERMKPTLGILKQKNQFKPRSSPTKVSIDNIANIARADDDVEMRTPPPTPTVKEERTTDSFNNKPVHTLLTDEVNEYLILDEMPHYQAALPEPSATEGVNDSLKAAGKQTPDTKACKVEKEKPREDEVIYTEVDESPQVLFFICFFNYFI